jgi:RHS repeat-associated protein
LYDNFARIKTKIQIVDGITYSTDFTYDANNNLLTTSYPSGLIIENRYDSKSYITEVLNANTNTKLYTTISSNGLGQITQYLLGNGQTTDLAYNSGALVEDKTAGVQHFNYTWDLASGNLVNRQDGIHSLQEDFLYDNQNRLTAAQVLGQPIQSFNYDPFPATGSISQGNIKQSSESGFYRYGAVQPHAQSSIAHLASTTAPPPNISAATQQIRYTSFNRVVNITENTFEQTFDYWANYDRVKSVLTQSSNKVYTRYYFGNYEKHVDANGDAIQLHYISGAVGTCAIIVVDKNGDVLTNYVYKDHLGSFTTFTDDVGNVIAQQSFDAWGKYRNPTDWTYSVTTAPPIAWITRGYTSHEHLPEFGLINMNARLYDAVVGKMLSPDNYVAGIYSPEGYNRYAYCRNNPLRYIDPSGNEVITLILTVAAICAVGNLAIQAANGEINSFDDGLEAFVAGAAVGAAVSGIVIAAWSVPVLGAIFKVTGGIYIWSTQHSISLGLARGIATNDWTSFRNTARLFAGNFYLDGNGDFGRQFTQGVSRFTWEILQSTIGYALASELNAIGQVDRVDYFGGITYSTNENDPEAWWGISLGNNISVAMAGEIQGPFRATVLGDPFWMHEYGHTFDSQLYGLTYLFAIGIPSLRSASNLRPSNIPGLDTHDIFWTELRANRHAANYFGQFGIDWTDFEPPLNTYPR